jgi:UDP-2,3-diacylglucosamine pyrophosphatase LpxH
LRVIVTEEKITTPDQIFHRCLISDLHLGSPNVDLPRLRQDLDCALHRKARVLINGDVFDAIDTRDKRSRADVVVPELRGRVDLISATVDYAFQILKPYAEVIDIIGIGNHENKWIEWNSVDPVRLLIEKLNAYLSSEGSSHQVVHGGIGGFWRTMFRDDARGAWTHDLYYFHGAGGDAPVTKRTVDMNRKAVQVNYDMVTFGHKHNKLFMDDVQMELSPAGFVVEKERKAVQTGSYYRNYRTYPESEAINMSYAEKFHHAAKPMGGMFAMLLPYRERIGPAASSLRLVKQIVVSDPLPMRLVG